MAMMSSSRMNESRAGATAGSSKMRESSDGTCTTAIMFCRGDNLPFSL
jgi:hypothetical protein